MMTSLILLLVLFTQAPPVADTTATIDGVVVLSTNGQPMSGARVQLAPDAGSFGPAGLERALEGGPRENLDRWASAVTMQDGRFVFQNVRPGKYRLFAFRSGGFVPGEYGQRSPTGSGIPFELSFGDRMRDVRLVLTPTGSISGRVYDRDGPVGRMQVQALKPIYRDGARVLTIVQSVQSNDRGEYRLFWLPPGQYYITAKAFNDAMTSGERITEPARSGTFEQAASPVITTRTLPTGEVVEETQLTVYYPGTTDANAATRVDVRAGGSPDGIDIPVVDASVRTRHIRGVVVANGQAAALAGVIAVPQSFAPSLSVPSGRSTSDGSFDIAGVLPGPYLVIAQPRSGPNVPGTVMVTVGDADVDNLVIPVGAGFQMTGRFVIEGRGRAGTFDLSLLRATLTRDPNVVGTPDSGVGYSPPPAADGSFSLQGMSPGDYRVAVRAIPPGMYIKSMRLGTADVLAGGLHIAAAPREPLEIVLADAGRVTGRAMSSRQEPVPNTRVVLIPDSADRRRADLYLSTTSDGAGQFQFNTVPPGTYSVLAWEEIEEGAWQDPAILRAYETRGTSVTVHESADATVQATVIPAR